MLRVYKASYAECCDLGSFRNRAHSCVWHRNQIAARFYGIILVYKLNVSTVSDINGEWQTPFLNTLDYFKHLKPLKKTEDAGSSGLGNEETEYLTNTEWLKIRKWGCLKNKKGQNSFHPIVRVICYMTDKVSIILWS